MVQTLAEPGLLILELLGLSGVSSTWGRWWKRKREKRDCQAAAEMNPWPLLLHIESVMDFRDGALEDQCVFERVTGRSHGAEWGGQRERGGHGDGREGVRLKAEQLGKEHKGKQGEGERKEGGVGHERRERRLELLRTDLNMALMQSCQDLFHWNVKPKLPFIFKFQDPPEWGAWLIAQLVECLPYMQEVLGSIHITHKHGTMVYTSIVPALQRLSQEDQKFKVLFGNTVSSRSIWSTQILL